MHRNRLNAFKREHHIHVARALLTKRNKRLILGRAVAGIEGIHVGELNDDDTLGLPMPSLGILWLPPFVR
jgi:hypothetical protein